MATEATNPKPSMPIEWYCQAVHKNTHERTFEYTGAEIQTIKNVGLHNLLPLSKFLISIAYKLKQLLSYFMHRTSFSS